MATTKLSTITGVAQVVFNSGPNTLYTPAYSASFGTIADSQIYQRPMGDKRHISGRFTIGTPTAATATLGLPNGEIVAVGAGAAQRWAVGRWSSNNAAANDPKEGPILALPGDAFVTFGTDEYDTAISGLTPQNASSIFGVGRIITLVGEVIVPTTALAGQTFLAQGAGLATATATGLIGAAGGSQSLGPVFSFPNQPSFSARKSGTTSSLATGVTQVVDFTVEEFDVGNYYNSTTSNFVPTVAGKYIIQAQVRVTATVAFTATSIQVYVNNVQTKVRGMQIGGTSQDLSVSVPLDLAAGASVEIRVSCDVSSGTWGIASGATTTWFSGHKLS